MRRVPSKRLQKDLQTELSFDEVTCTKIGRDKNWILMTLRNSQKRKNLLTGSIILKESPKCSKTYINPDYTKLEQQKQFNLLCELRHKRIDQPNKQWIISRNKIVEKAKRLTQDDTGELKVLLWNIEDANTKLNMLPD